MSKKVLFRIIFALCILCLCSSCLLYELEEPKTKLIISNPTSASVEVLCYWFDGSNTVMIPAYGSVTKELNQLPSSKKITLFGDGKYFQYHSQDVIVNSQTVRVTLKPNKTK